MSPGQGSPASGAAASPGGPTMLVQPAAVTTWMIDPPSGSSQWSSSGPATDPPVAPEQVPGDSMGAMSPSGAVYSVELGGKPELLLPPPLLLLLHATTSTQGPASEPPTMAPAVEREREIG